jgi:hypothetical protein
MKQVTLKEAADLLEVITITQSIDSGFAIIHHGHIEGQPTIAVRAAATSSSNQNQAGQQGKRTTRLPCRLANSVTSD